MKTEITEATFVKLSLREFVALTGTLMGMVAIAVATYLDLKNTIKESTRYNWLLQDSIAWVTQARQLSTNGVYPDPSSIYWGRRMNAFISPRHPAPHEMASQP